MADGTDFDRHPPSPFQTGPGELHSSDARRALSTLSEPQRLALATEIVLGASETASRLQLRRLITAANRVSLELGAKALERGKL